MSASDALQRQNVLVQRLAAGEVTKFKPFLRMIDKELRARLAGEDLTLFERARLERLIDGVDAMLKAVLEDYGRQMVLDLQAFGEHEAGVAARAVAIGEEMVDVYHGTAAAYVDSIRNDGLTVFKAHRNKERAGYHTFVRGEKGRAVYVTTSREDALKYAVQAARYYLDRINPGAPAKLGTAARFLFGDPKYPMAPAQLIDAAVLHFRVPASLASEVDPLDNLGSGKGGVRIAGQLDAKYLVDYEVHTRPQFMTTPEDIADTTITRHVVREGVVPSGQPPKALNAEDFATLRGPVDAPSGYAYHATNVERALDIAESGIETHAPGFGTDQDIWPDGSTQRRSYFGSNARTSWSFVPDEGKGVLLRVRSDAAEFKTESGTGDLYATRKIAAKDVEFLAADGTWQPLARSTPAPPAAATTLAAADFESVIPAVTQVRAAILSQPLAVRGPDGGQLLEPFIRGWTAAERKAVTGAIRLGVFEGKTNAELIRTLRGTRATGYSDGVLATTARHAEAVVRTAVQHVSTVARSEAFKANADLVVKVRWLSTLDKRTCPRCGALDGREFPVKKGPRPPLHPNCRCTTVPVLADEFAGLDAGMKRPAKGAKGPGQVDANESYFTWLKRQPAAFQNAAIGVSRAKLLRSGGLTPSRFAALQVDKQFMPLTLDEMRALEPLAFQKAGL